MSIFFSLVLFKHSFNSIKPLLSSIASLSEITEYHSKINLLIYDGSPPSFASPSLKQISHCLPLVAVSYEKGVNLGFSCSNNQNFSRVTLLPTDLFIVVNPDISFCSDQILPLLNWASSHSEYSCIAPLIKLENGQIQYSAKHNPTILSLLLGRFKYLLRFSLLYRYDYWHRNLGRDYLTEIIVSTYLSGCFLIIPVWAYLKVGGFSSQYFLHVEDADLVRKLSSIGTTVHNPLGVVTHGWARGSHSSILQTFLLIKSYLIYCQTWGLRLM